MRQARELSRYVEVKAGGREDRREQAGWDLELPCPGIKPVPPALQVRSLTHQGSPIGICCVSMKWPLNRPHLVLLCFPLLCFTHISFFFLNKLKVCGDLLLSKSVGTIFPTAFVHFLSLCHILAILAIFQNFSLLLYLLWWSRDHWSWMLLF